MRLKAILSILMILCLWATGVMWSVAEEGEPEPGADEVTSEDVRSEAVEAEVDEVEFSLEDDETTVVLGEPEEAGEALEAPELTETVDEDVDVFEQWDPDDYVIHCPDVCDDVIRNQVTPSERVYPGELVWPLKGLEPLTNLSSHVGWRDAGRIQRHQGGTWASWLHHGIDVGRVDTDQVVVAAADGLAYAGSCDGLGNYVVIDHQNGWYTRYQHMSAFAGDITVDCQAVPVRAGDDIGYVGGTGGDYPVHLHFEIAWSPDGPGADDKTYQIETHNRKIRAYSFPQQKKIYLRWAERWEICTAENQNFLPLEKEEEE